MEFFEATLRPFAELTDAMSMERTVGICKLFPLLKKIQTYSQRPIDDNDELTEAQLAQALTIRGKIWDYMDKR